MKFYIKYILILWLLCLQCWADEPYVVPAKIFNVDFNSAKGKTEIKVGDSLLNAGSLGSINTLGFGLGGSTTSKVSVIPSVQGCAAQFGINSTDLYFSNTPIQFNRKFSSSVLIKIESDSFRFHLISSNSGLLINWLVTENEISVFYSENSLSQKHRALSNLQLPKNVWIELLLNINLDAPLNQQVLLSNRVVLSEGGPGQSSSNTSEPFQSITTIVSDVTSFNFPIPNTVQSNVNFLKLDLGIVTIQNFRIFNDDVSANVKTYLLNTLFTSTATGDIGLIVNNDFYNRIQNKMNDVSILTQAQIKTQLANHSILADTNSDFNNKFYGVIMFKVQVDKTRFSSGTRTVSVYAKVKDKEYKKVASQNVDFNDIANFPETGSFVPVYLFWDTRNASYDWQVEDAKATRLNPGEIKFKFSVK